MDFRTTKFCGLYDIRDTKESENIKPEYIKPEYLEYTESTVQIAIQRLVEAFVSKHRNRGIDFIKPEYIKMPSWIFGQIVSQYNRGNIPFGVHYNSDKDIWYLHGMMICPVSYIYKLEEMDVF